MRLIDRYDGLINRQTKRYDKLANISFLLLSGIVLAEHAEHVGFLANLFLSLLGPLVVGLDWIGAKRAQELSNVGYFHQFYLNPLQYSKEGGSALPASYHSRLL